MCKHENKDLQKPNQQNVYNTLPEKDEKMEQNNQTCVVFLD